MQRTFVLQNKPIPFIFGLKSLGQSCATPVPGVYTLLSSYKAWIEAIVGESFDHEGESILECYLHRIVGNPVKLVTLYFQLVQFVLEVITFFINIFCILYKYILM